MALYEWLCLFLRAEAGIDLRRHIPESALPTLLLRAGRWLIVLLALLAGVLVLASVKKRRGQAVFSSLSARDELARWIAAARSALVGPFLRDHWVYGTIFGLVLTFALVLRILHLGLPLSGDEGMVFYELARRPVYVILAYYENVGNHVFHTLLTHATWRVFGDTAWGIRLPVFLCGILLVPLCTLASRASQTSRASRASEPGRGLLAAALVAQASVLVEYSANARGYMVQALLQVLHFLMAQRILAGMGGALSFWIYIGTAVLALYTVPTAIMVHLGLLVWLAVRLVCAKNRECLQSLLLAQVLIALGAWLLYGPILIVNQPLHSVSVVTRGPALLSSLSLCLGFFKEILQQWTRNLPLPLSGFLVGCGLWSLLPRRTSSGLELDPLPFLVLAALCVGAFVPLLPRLLLVHGVFFCLGCAEVLGLLVQRMGRIAWGVPVLLVLAGTYGEIKTAAIKNRQEDAFPEAPAIAETLVALEQATPPADEFVVFAPGPLFYPLLHEFRLRGFTMVPASLPAERGPTMVMALSPSMSKQGSAPHFVSATLRRPKRIYAVVRKGQFTLSQSLQRFGLSALLHLHQKQEPMKEVGLAAVYIFPQGPNDRP